MTGNKGRGCHGPSAIDPANLLCIVHAEIVVGDSEISVGIIIPGRITPIPLAVIKLNEIPCMDLACIAGNVDILYAAIVEQKLERLGVGFAHTASLDENTHYTVRIRRILGRDTVRFICVEGTVNDPIVE